MNGAHVIQSVILPIGVELLWQDGWPNISHYEKTKLELPSNSCGVHKELRFFAAGGFHRVFVPADGTNICVKIPHCFIEPSPASLNEYALLPKAASYSLKMNREYAELARTVGRDVCIASIWLVGIYQQNTATEQIVPLLIQPWERSFHSSSSIRINAQYFEFAEQGDYGTNDLRAIDILFRQNTEHTKNFLSERYPWFDQLRRTIRDHVDLRIRLEKFLRSCAYFVKRSGRFIDLVGNNNLVISMEKEGGKIRVGSVLKEDSMQGMLNALADIRAPESAATELSMERARMLMNGIAMTRALNAIGAALESNFCLTLDLTANDLSVLSSRSVIDAVRRSAFNS